MSRAGAEAGVRPPPITRDVAWQLAVVVLVTLLPLRLPPPTPPDLPPVERQVRIVRLPPAPAVEATPPLEAPPEPPAESSQAPPPPIAAQPRPAAGARDGDPAAARAAAVVAATPEAPAAVAPAKPATPTRPSPASSAPPAPTPARASPPDPGMSAAPARGSIRHGAPSAQDDGLPLEILLPASTWGLESHLRAVDGCITVVRREAQRDVELSRWDLLGGRVIPREGSCGAISRTLDDPSFLIAMGDPVGQTRQHGGAGVLGVTVRLGAALGPAIRQALTRAVGTADLDAASTALRERGQVLRCDAMADGGYDCAAR